MNRIDELIAIEEIKRLKSAYIRCIDGKQWEQMLQVWAPDATFDVRAGSSVDGASEDAADNKFSRDGFVVGAQNILAMMRDFAPAGMVSVHVGYMPDIEIISDTTAKGIWGLEDIVTWASGQPFNSLHGYGHWRDTYERIAGRWTIKTSKVTRIKVQTT